MEEGIGKLIDNFAESYKAWFMMKRLMLLIILASLFCQRTWAESASYAKVQKLLAKAETQLGSSMDKAVEYASEALLLAQYHNLPLQTAQAQLYLAKGYHHAGDYDQALKRCQQALKGFEALGNDKGIADAYEQMGNIYWRLEREDQVKECFAKSLAIRRKLKDPAGLADALNNAGIVQLHYLNNPDLALKYYQEALAKSSAADHKAGMAHSLNNIGNYYLMQDDVQQSLDYNTQSLRLYTALGDTNRMAINTLIVGYLHQLIGNPKKAEELYFLSIRLARRTQAAAVVRDANLNLSALYEAQGRELLHLKYYKEYAVLADSILSVETNRNLANLQTQHEVEKRELENRILRLNIQKQRIFLASLLLFSLLVVIGLGIINRERKRSEKLLLNILPRKVAQELKSRGYSIPQTFNGVSVLFSDFVDFTRISSSMEPEELINKLTLLFTSFDDLCEANGCERIKTIGDAYLAVCGLPQAYPDHAQRLLQVAIGMLEAVECFNQSSETAWQIRIGLHSGTVVGGIVGKKKYIYDVFGDAINTASRMESHSTPMRINVSEEFYKLIDHKQQFEPRGETEVKGKGLMSMYFWKG